MTKKQIYKKVRNSALNLLVWNNDLPDSIGNLNIKLTKFKFSFEEKKYKNF